MGMSKKNYMSLLCLTRQSVSTYFDGKEIVGSSPTMTERRDGIPASSAGMTERMDAPKKKRKKSMLDGRGILLYISYDKSLPIKAAGNLSVC